MYAELKQKVCPKCKTGRPASVKRCNQCHADQRALRRSLDRAGSKERDFNTDLKKHYGITADDYKAMWNKQLGCCDACGQHESLFKRKLHVDHEHTTGQVRALLCTQCNPGLGYFQDSIERLEMAITYLKKFKK